MDAFNIFNAVRDLPYHCPESRDDVDHRCWGKHRLLYDKFIKNGYKVRYRVCEFKWADLDLPQEIIKKAPKEIDHHLFLEIYLQDTWITLDCSDDPTLHLIDWDGHSHTKLSVKPLNILSPEESARIEESERKNYNLILEEYHDLYCAINEFLESMRKFPT